jgi:hydroxymethylglutaryl-CoA reductase
MNESFGIGVAPGKVILLGEHTVVYGEPAVASAIDRRLEVTVRRRRPKHRDSTRDLRAEAALASAAGSFGIDPCGLSVEVKSQIPMACGLGSSAALSLALVRALASLERESISEEDAASRAAQVEAVFHGTPSGVDVAAIAHGGIIWFERYAPDRVTELVSPEPADLVVGLSGELRSTAEPVARLRARREQSPETYGEMFRIAGDLARAGRTALEGGQWETLGSLMDVAQGLLNAFGVSTPTLERMVDIARGAGALGAKLTGAGGGGAIIALAPRGAGDIVSALRDEGFEAFGTRIGAEKEDGDAVRSRSA